MTTQLIFAKIATASFSFYYHGNDDDELKTKAKEQKDKAELQVVEYFNKLYKLLSDMGIKHTHKLKEDWRDQNYNFTFPDIDCFVGKEEFFDIIEAGYEIKVISRHAVSGAEVDLTNAAEKAQRIVDKLGELLSGTFPEISYNSKCDVHVPGLGLLSINRTLLLEDSCTDMLQSALSEGWRIIAACPQPNSRRPDYILGKYDPAYDSGNGDSAARSI